MENVGSFEMKCPQGHTWKAHMIKDTFGWKYTNELSAKCPKCGQLALVADVYLPKRGTKTL